MMNAEVNRNKILTRSLGDRTGNSVNIGNRRGQLSQQVKSEQEELSESEFF